MLPVDQRPIRVMALMEASVVGGPAKNLIRIGVRGKLGSPALDLTLVTFVRAGIPNKFAQAAIDAGIRVHTLTERRRFDTLPIEQLRILVHQHSPDILQSHNIKSHLFVRWLGLQHFYPWIVFQHGYTTTNWKDRLYNQVDRFTLPSAAGLVAVCQAFANRLQERGVPAERIRVLHNSVQAFEAPEAQVVSQLRRQLGIPRDESIILVVGRLSREKGHRDVLSAAALLPNRRWRMVFLGEGPEYDNLISQARSMGLNDQIIFAGQHSDVRPYYSLADILALPSHTEGSPNVVLEAMAAGVPIAACAVGGVPEILTHEETGLLVPPQDPPAMAEQLSRLLTSLPLRSRLAAAALAHSESFSPEAQYQRLYSIYREFLSR